MLSAHRSNLFIIIILYFTFIKYTFLINIIYFIHWQNKYTKSFERNCIPKSFERIAIDMKSFKRIAIFRKISACISFEIFRNKFRNILKYIVKYCEIGQIKTMQLCT